MKLTLIKKEFLIIFIIVFIISLFTLFIITHRLNQSTCIYTSVLEVDDVTKEEVGEIARGCLNISPYSKEFFNLILPVFVISIISIIPLFFINKNIKSKKRLAIIFSPYIIILLLGLLLYGLINILGSGIGAMEYLYVVGGIAGTATIATPFMIIFTPSIAFIVILIYTVIFYKKLIKPGG